MDTKDSNTIFSNDIVCICETFVEPHRADVFSKFDSELYVTVSHAQRSSQHGRGSGGLVVLVRRSTFQCETSQVNPHFISVNLKHMDFNTEFSLILYYFSPSEDNSLCSHVLSESCVSALDNLKNVLIVGDINCKIGNLNQFNEHCN